MIKRSGVGLSGAALRRSQGFSAESEALGLSCRVRRAAPSLQMLSEVTVVASYGPTKTAILTMLSYATQPCASPPPPAYAAVSNILRVGLASARLMGGKA